MKQSNELGFFAWKSKSRALFKATNCCALAMLLLLGFQTVRANNNLENKDLTVAPQSTITGTVTDDTGAPLPGANVLVKGTTNGTQTDFDGNYTITADGDATLVFSYIGFSSQEIAVGGQSTINVSLAEDASQLEEVVVLGYSTQTRGELTGSVASVDVAEATKLPIVNAAEALQGRVTGVTVIQSGDPGTPPKINIRGFGTSNNTNPLYIIDGLQTDDPFVLNSINPNDIDQMNVLKDGAAAIYGARGANGVIIVTTKAGGYNMEKPIVSIDTYTGFSQATNLPELLSAQQHGDMLFQGAANDGVAFDHPQYGSGSSAVVPNQLIGYTRIASYSPEQVSVPVNATVAPGGTDWLDAIFRTAPTQSVSLSVANGEENSKYALSANYLNRQGVLLDTEFKQGTLRLNSEFKLGDRVRIGQHLSTAYSNGHGGGGAQVAGAVRSSPLIPVFDDEGNFAGTSLGSGGTGNARNPVAQLARGDNDFNKTLRVLGDLYLSAEILNGLTFKTSIGGAINSYDARRFQALDPEHGEPLGTNTLTELHQAGYEWTFTNTLNYKKTFDDHKVDVLLGIEANKQGLKINEISRNGFFNETPDYYLLENGDPNFPPNVNFSLDRASSLYSLFGSATYSFADKYFLTGTIRNDTSSRFSEDTKSDIFPSVSAGWVISKEDFLADSEIVSWLKLKGSWGQLGNQTLPVNNPNINISGLDPGTGNYSLDGSTIATGAILSAVGNDGLKWETSVVTNAGFELGLFDNRLNLDFEWWNKDTEDLILQNFNLISSTAIDAAAPWVNFGNVNNKGIDINLNYKNESDAGLEYSFAINYSRYKNEVTALISDFLIPNSGLRGGDVTRTEVGGPISAFYGREVTGFDDTGRFTFLETGDDGTNRKVIGNPHPDFTYGINLNVGYKGFDIAAFIQGSQGNDIYNYTKIFTDFPTFVNGNRSTRVLDSWTPTNTDATLPALTNSLVPIETEPNSYFVEDGSYLRLKNLQIGYALPENIVEKMGMDSFRVYIQGTNLLTFTGYDGLDPEIVSFNNLNLGVDAGAVPVANVYTLGFNIKL